MQLVLWRLSIKVISLYNLWKSTGTKSGDRFKNRHIDQWNWVENPEINPCTYGQVTYNKGGKSTQGRKGGVFNKWRLETWTATCRRMKVEHSLTPSTKINSRWIKHLNVRLEAIELLNRNTGKIHWHRSWQCFFGPVSYRKASEVAQW